LLAEKRDRKEAYRAANDIFDCVNTNFNSKEKKVNGKREILKQFARKVVRVDCSP
jgi:DNA-binding transcriptional regulator GbsR (MarR family)